MHVCLVFTPIDPHYQDALTHYAPPLGLVALANYLDRENPDCRVSILDGSVAFDQRQIEDFIVTERPDVVAQSIQLISYANCLRICQVVKDCGLTSVVGGHHATHMATKIVKNRPDLIDYVVVGDGEQAISALARGEGPNAPNTLRMHDNEVITNPIQSLRMSQLPILDYSTVDLAPYKLNVSNSNFGLPVGASYLRMYSHKGCGNRHGTAACYFCGRADIGVRFKRPARFWAEFESLLNRFQASYVFDVGDDFLASLGWLKQVRDARPTSLPPYQFGIFGRANRVSPEVAALLAEIGVTDVVIGFESGNESVLHRSGKAMTSPEVNHLAAQSLMSHGIDVTASYVLGLPGETRESLRDTVRSASSVAALAARYLGRPPREMVANLLEPSPGSPAFRDLERCYPAQYAHEDNLSLERMQFDYLRITFGLDSLRDVNRFRAALADTAREIHALVPFSDAQGWLDEELRG